MGDSQQLSVIGIGNPDCGDDGAGHVVIDLLEKARVRGAILVKVSGEVSGLLEILSRNQSAILIDAIATVSDRGKIHRFDAGLSPLPSEFFSNYSTHSMGVDEAVEMARVLGELPEKIIVYGIEGANFEAGQRMCPEVLSNLDRLVKKVFSEISTLTNKFKATSN